MTWSPSEHSGLLASRRGEGWGSVWLAGVFLIAHGVVADLVVIVSRSAVALGACVVVGLWLLGVHSCG
jgi:hypothetical protein